MDNNNGAVWCRHIKIKGLVLEIEINLILTLDGIASSDLHYQPVLLCLLLTLSKVLFLIFVQGLVLDCYEKRIPVSGTFDTYIQINISPDPFRVL